MQTPRFYQAQTYIASFKTASKTSDKNIIYQELFWPFLILTIALTYCSLYAINYVKCFIQNNQLNVPNDRMRNGLLFHHTDEKTETQKVYHAQN